MIVFFTKGLYDLKKNKLFTKMLDFFAFGFKENKLIIFIVLRLSNRFSFFDI